MKEFRQIIIDLTVLFRELTELAKIKLNASRNNQIAAIEECMTKEQSLSLRLKGLDKAREKKQEELGYGGMSFREILEKVPEEEKEELFVLFDSLSREIQMYQQVSEDAACIMKINERQLQKWIDEREGHIYDNNGAEAADKSRVTDRSI